MSNLTAKDVSVACDEMVRLQDKVAELERTVSAMDGALRVLFAECDQQPDVMVFEIHKDTIAAIRAAVK